MYDIAEKIEFTPRFLYCNLYSIDLPQGGFSGLMKQTTEKNFLLSGGTLKPREDVLQQAQAEYTQLLNDDGF